MLRCNSVSTSHPGAARRRQKVSLGMPRRTGSIRRPLPEGGLTRMARSAETTLARAVGETRLAGDVRSPRADHQSRRKRAAEGATAGVPQTLYPVVRLGQLVRATVSDTSHPRALSLKESDAALRLLDSRAADTLSAMQSGMAKVARDQGRKFRLLDAKTAPLASAGPARGLGAVYNYEEFAVELDRAVMVVRNSVTLCVAPANDVLEMMGGQVPYSKVWTRFNLIEHPASGAPKQRAVDLSAKVLGDVEADCRLLAAAAVEAIVRIYGEVLEKVTKEHLLLDATNNGEFTVVTLGLSGGDSDLLFRDTLYGRPLSEQVKDGAQAARRFAEFALPALQRDPQVKLAQALKRFREDETCKFIRYETPDAEKGVFVASFKGNSARFVGVALDQRDLADEDEAVDFADAAHLSANVVSAGLIARFARRF
jgi:hypothetical protein